MRIYFLDILLGFMIWLSGVVITQQRALLKSDELDKKRIRFKAQGGFDKGALEVSIL